VFRVRSQVIRRGTFASVRTSSPPFGDSPALDGILEEVSPFRCREKQSGAAQEDARDQVPHLVPLSIGFRIGFVVPSLDVTER
jgi:hypothetical protein